MPLVWTLFWALVWALAWVLASAPPAAARGPAQDAAPAEYPEYEVKAAFLYNFARFVEWPEPERQDAPLHVCILGDDPFGEAFATIEGRQVRGRELTVERRSEVGDAACDILFISASERRRLGDILGALGERPILTVSEVDGFTGHGGMVNFVLERQKVRFEINAAAAERAGLVISAKLLRVARVVRD